jgi:hypothetical protein
MENFLKMAYHMATGHSVSVPGEAAQAAAHGLSVKTPNPHPSAPASSSSSAMREEHYFDPHAGPSAAGATAGHAGALGTPMDVGAHGGIASSSSSGSHGAAAAAGGEEGASSFGDGHGVADGAAISSIPPPWYVNQLPPCTWKVKPQYAGFEIDHKRFEIVKQLGKGSYGVVVEAIDHLTGKRVAIKKIHQVFEVSLERRRSTLRGCGQYLQHFARASAGCCICPRWSCACCTGERRRPPSK